VDVLGPHVKTVEQPPGLATTGSGPLDGVIKRRYSLLERMSIRLCRYVDRAIKRRGARAAQRGEAARVQADRVCVTGYRTRLIQMF
jgi:hypothetical protein